MRLASTPPGFDVVVVDTAPTGHALRLLASPKAVRSLVNVLEALQREHRIIREQLARVRGPDAADRLIAGLEREARDTHDLLLDRTRTRVRWVMLAEELAVAEMDALQALDGLGVPVHEIIINRVTPPGPPCPVCDRRREAEGKVIARLRRNAHLPPVRLLEAELKEPRGAAGLRRIGAEMHAGVVADLQVRLRAAGHRRVARDLVEPAFDRRLAWHPVAVLRRQRRVGKTTVAAAIALRLARDSPGQRVLLLSTDPAHSLGDACGPGLGCATARGGRSVQPPVRELDPPAALAARRLRLEASLQALAEALGRAEMGTMMAAG